MAWRVFHSQRHCEGMIVPVGNFRDELRRMPSAVPAPRRALMDKPLIYMT